MCVAKKLILHAIEFSIHPLNRYLIKKITILEKKLVRYKLLNNKI